MKKIVFLLFVSFIFLFCITKNSKLLIPNEAIRIRIIANSDSIKDQEIKAEVKNDVNNYLFNKLSKISTYSDAENIMKGSLTEIDDIVGKHTEKYNIYYGSNYFPEKEYKGVNYKEGNYNSLVISLGEGQGENFWCVLFPPLCLIDENNMNDNTYELYVLNLLKKIK